MYYNEIFASGLQKWSLKNELSDIMNKGLKTPEYSDFVIRFKKKNQRLPTEQECRERMAEIYKELAELENAN